jgi:hypothetical protein
MARHTRRDVRFQDLADPDHPKPLLEQRKKACAHQLFLRLLALSPRAAASSLTRAERRLNPQHHGRNIVALSAISAQEAVARALEEALTYEVCSSESMANLLEQRARVTPEASVLPRTRRADLLAISLAPPDLSLDHAPLRPNPTIPRSLTPCLHATTRHPSQRPQATWSPISPT